MALSLPHGPREEVTLPLSLVYWYQSGLFCYVVSPLKLLPREMERVLQLGLELASKMPRTETATFSGDHSEAAVSSLGHACFTAACVLHSPFQPSDFITILPCTQPTMATPALSLPDDFPAQLSQLRFSVPHTKFLRAEIYWLSSFFQTRPSEPLGSLASLYI